MRRYSVLLAVGLVACGCSGLPAPAGSVLHPAVPRVPGEVVRSDAEAPPLAESVELIAPDGARLAGRSAVQSHLRDDDGGPRYRVTTQHVYLCDGRILQIGGFRSRVPAPAEAPHLGVGGYLGVWQPTGTGGWALARIHFNPPEPNPAVLGTGCVRAEAVALLRRSTSVAVMPYGLSWGGPAEDVLAEMRFAGWMDRGPDCDSGGCSYSSSYPLAERAGAALSLDVRHRLNRWLGVQLGWARPQRSVLAGVDPRTKHRLELTAGAWYASATPVIHHRFFRLGGGPAMVRAEWDWQEHRSRFESADVPVESLTTSSTRLGLVTTGAATLPITSRVSVEVVGHRWFFGSVPTPDFREMAGSRAGLDGGTVGAALGFHF